MNKEEETNPTLWGGRFEGKMDPDTWRLNASLDFDRRLGPQDVRGSLAWARALAQAGVLSPAEGKTLVQGLEAIQVELEQGGFPFRDSDEDIHSAVERRLGELVGPLAGKLHTGRSRNDQVTTDFRLWLLQHLPGLDHALQGLQSTLLARAERDLGILMPGYTHLQPAQPILLGHWWLSHFWPLARDRERLAQLRARTAIMPLGSGALAGTPFPIDRPALAAALGFEAPSANSLDAVSDRDFALEFLFSAALTGLHISRLGEAVVLFTSPGYGFFELSDAFSSGSSLMPQKKNPDPFELARGKAGALLGKLTGLAATLKALPSAYDKDLQEDKTPVFEAYDQLIALLPVLAGGLETLTIHPEALEAALDPAMMATDLADYLVVQGIPFREAHNRVGRLVRQAHETGRPLGEVALAGLQAEAPALTADELKIVLDPRASTDRRRAWGGTAKEALLTQIEVARYALG